MVGQRHRRANDLHRQTDSNWHLFSATNSPGGSTFWNNGVWRGSNIPSEGDGTSTPNGLTFGGWENAEAEVVAVIAYDRLLADAERRAVEAWLIGRYGPFFSTTLACDDGRYVFDGTTPYCVPSDDFCAFPGTFDPFKGCLAECGAHSAPYDHNAGCACEQGYVYDVATTSCVPYCAAGVGCTNPTFAEPSAYADLRLWVSADHGATLDGDRVAQWADRSGAGLDFVQEDPARRPTPVADVLNQRPALRMEASESRTMTSSVDFPSGSATVTYLARKRNGSGERLLSGWHNNWLLGWWSDRAHVAYGRRSTRPRARRSSRTACASAAAPAA